MSKIYVIPDERFESASIKESSGISYRCPTNTVLTGRYHTGDENGTTKYQYATLKAVDEQGNTVDATITVTDVVWSEEIKESDSSFIAPAGRVLVGRYHTGDENGKTKYKIGRIKYNGSFTNVVNAQSVAPYQEYYESAGVFFRTYPNLLFIGRQHVGDENASTFNYQGLVKA